MKKCLIILCLASLGYANNFLELFNQNLNATPQIQSNDMTITDINGKNFNVAKCQMMKNENFYVIREFNNNIVIIAKAQVFNKQDDICQAMLLSSYDLEQKSMPSIKKNIKTTDKILQDIKYKRALTISPNLAGYENTLDQEMTYIHPDIFIGFLAYDSNKKPKTKDFKKFCLLNDIGVVNIVLKDKTYKLDCGSFKILEIFDSKTDFDETQNYIYSNANYKLNIKYQKYFQNLINTNNK